MRLAAAELLEVGDAEVRGVPAANTSVKVSAQIVVYPPALPPVMRSRSRSASPWLDEVAGGVDAVLEVDDAPLPVQPLAVRAAVAGRAAVVDVDDGEAATRPELDAEAERSASRSPSGRRGSSTMSGGRSPSGASKSGFVGG